MNVGAGAPVGRQHDRQQGEGILSASCKSAAEIDPIGLTLEMMMSAWSCSQSGCSVMKLFIQNSATSTPPTAVPGIVIRSRHLRSVYTSKTSVNFRSERNRRGIGFPEAFVGIWREGRETARDMALEE